MPDFSIRAEVEEMMDDVSIVDERLTVALDNLRGVNRYLGGYAAMRRALAPCLPRWRGRRIEVLDLATGAADYASVLVRWADRQGVEAHVLALDVNPVTVDYARLVVARDLPERLRHRVRVEVGDALRLDVEDRAFDVCMAAHFLHHLSRSEAVALLREMARVAREGIVVNDLHRHVLAYYGIRAIGAVLPVSPMFRHDGPISVLRGFTRAELRDLADAAGLEDSVIRWRWAFRWVLSTL